MESTRSQVLNLLHRQSQVTVTELARSLDLTVGAVRWHLDSLRAEGLVDMRQVRHGVGRPSFAFFLTEKGAEAASHGYSRLVERLVQEVSGRSSELMATVFEGIAERVADEYRPEVNGPTLERKIDQVTVALREEGILDTWQKAADGYHLLNGECPYRRAALVSRSPCAADLRVIELLLGSKVEQVGRVVEGHPYCEYIVQPVIPIAPKVSIQKAPVES